MTIGMACAYNGGVLLGSDSCVSQGDQIMYTTDIKAFAWNGCYILFAGALDAIQKFKDVKPTTNWGSVFEVQAAVKELELSKKERGQFELCVVDTAWELYIISGHADLLHQTDYAIVGAASGLVALDMVYPKLRNRTMSNTQKMMASALRAVCKRTEGCGGPLHYWVIE